MCSFASSAAAAAAEASPAAAAAAAAPAAAAIVAAAPVAAALAASLRHLELRFELGAKAKLQVSEPKRISRLQPKRNVIQRSAGPVNRKRWQPRHSLVIVQPGRSTESGGSHATA